MCLRNILLANNTAIPTTEKIVLAQPIEQTSGGDFRLTIHFWQPKRYLAIPQLSCNKYSNETVAKFTCHGRAWRIRNITCYHKYVWDIVFYIYSYIFTTIQYIHLKRVSPPQHNNIVNEPIKSIQTLCSKLTGYIYHAIFFLKHIDIYI